jgi:hypothetical protein
MPHLPVSSDCLRYLLHDWNPGEMQSRQHCVDRAYCCDNCHIANLHPVQGVRIVSNSWSNNNDNVRYHGTDSSCTIMDTYLWSRQDLLLLFAAGNRVCGADLGCKISQYLMQSHQDRRKQL